MDFCTYKNIPHHPDASSPSFCISCPLSLSLFQAAECSEHARKEHSLSAVEEDLLKALKDEPSKIATHINKNEVGKWNVLIDVLKAYKTAGIQVNRSFSINE